MKIFQVTENIFRGPEPKSQEDVDALVFSGIKTVFNLEPDGENTMFEWCMNRGIIQIDMPLSQVFPPKKLEVQAGLKILQAKDLFPIFVHCRTGVDRTGFMCAAYRRQVQGFTYQAAVKEWDSYGPHPWLVWWQIFLESSLNLD